MRQSNATIAAGWRGSREGVIYQLSWETAPGLGGLRCEDFRAVAVARPETLSGVAVECPSEAEAQAIVRALEEHFAKKRFSNTAAAFEAVKSFVLEWTADKRI
jgi:hypothetical protein